MKNVFFICLIILSLLFAGHAKSANTLRFTAEDLYPLHFINQKGQSDGFLVDVVNAILNECSCDGSIEIMPQARAFRELQTDANTLMMSLLKTPSRAKNYDFLGEVYTAHAYLVGKNERQFQLTDLQSARGLRVSTVRGYFSQRYLENAGFTLEKDLVLAPEPASLMKMLYKDRTDLVLTNTLHLEEELKSIGLDPTKIEKKLRLADFPSELHIVANKALPKETKNAISSAIKSIKHSGHYNALLAKWHLSNS
ncbi:substrate-binding periplasmic protein [Pseudoalteromonas sp. SSM20]|uniref:substrate-binding periplasmic protein n=1 Tax=Pseudoalteromonas sp. SSM20 TaxID=3139394 RepID=UPI003BAA9724